MITIESIEIGHIYGSGDDGIYLAVYKGSDWVLFLDYSFNHGLSSPYIVNAEWFSDEYIQENLKDITNDNYIQEIYESLKYVSSDMLRYECDK